MRYGQTMSVTEDILDVPTSDGEMAVVRAQPDGEVRGRVVIFMDAPGIRPSLRTFAKRLAETGYDVAMPDLWHRHGRLIGFEPDQMASNPDAMVQIGTMLGSLSDHGVSMDRDATLEALAWNSGPIAAIGFCMGARAVFRAMEDYPDRFVAGAMWHPSFLVDNTPTSPHLTAGSLRGELWMGIGEEDQLQSIAMHQPFLDAVAELDHVSVDYFAGADHGYTWPVAPNYHQHAATVSWDNTMAVFDRAFS